MILSKAATAFTLLLASVNLGVSSYFEPKNTTCVIDSDDGSEQCHDDPDFQPTEDQDYYVTSIYEVEGEAMPNETYNFSLSVDHNGWAVSDEIKATISCETTKEIISFFVSLVTGIIGLPFDFPGLGGDDDDIFNFIIETIWNFVGLVTCNEGEAALNEIHSIKAVFEDLYRIKEAEKAFVAEQSYSGFFKDYKGLLPKNTGKINFLLGKVTNIVDATHKMPLLTTNLLFRCGIQIHALILMLIGQSTNSKECLAEVQALESNKNKILRFFDVAEKTFYSDYDEIWKTCNEICGYEGCGNGKTYMGWKCRLKRGSVTDVEFVSKQCAKKDGDTCPTNVMKKAKSRTDAEVQKYVAKIYHNWKYMNNGNNTKSNNNRSGWYQYKREFDRMTNAVNWEALKDSCASINNPTPHRTPTPTFQVTYEPSPIPFTYVYAEVLVKKAQVCDADYNLAGKSDPYVIVKIIHHGTERECGQTTMKSGTHDPVWNELISCKVIQFKSIDSPSIKIDAWDDDSGLTGGDDFIGTSGPMPIRKGKDEYSGSVRLVHGDCNRGSSSGDLHYTIFVKHV